MHRIRPRRIEARKTGERPSSRTRAPAFAATPDSRSGRLSGGITPAQTINTDLPELVVLGCGAATDARRSSSFISTPFRTARGRSQRVR